MNRSGVALIIAISVLAALLFLALPFVYSQSASVAGARSASWDGASRRGADRATGLATALATYATGLHRSPDLVLQLDTEQFSYVQLPRQIGDANGLIRYQADAASSWRTFIDSGARWVTPNIDLPGLDTPTTTPTTIRTAVHGATIEDESRRIEPNCLDMHGWAVVLKRASIQDPWTVAMHWDHPDGRGGPQPYSNVPRYHWQMVTYGRLARALTYWRPNNGSRRFNRLEDLLGADPNEPVDGARTLGCVPFYALSRYSDASQPSYPDHYPVSGRSGWPVAKVTVEDTRNAAEVDPLIKDADNLGWRIAPLTQAELERLRPLLSFLIPGQGRSGLIDLGTVVAPDGLDAGEETWGAVTDELSPADTGVVGGAIRIDRTWAHSATQSHRHVNNGWVKSFDPLAIDAIPSLNLNTVPAASGMTRLYLAQGLTEPDTHLTLPDYLERILAEGWPGDPIDTPITSIGHMPRLRWLDPRTGDGTTNFERPPLGIVGYGIVAVEGLSTVRDAQGNAVASRRRRTVVQAVPQERPIEAAWTSQGDFESLVRLRHGSWVVAGPHPTSRVHDWGSDTTVAPGTTPTTWGRQDMLALDGPGWLEPAPMCTFGRNPAVSIAWRVPFGLTKAQTWANVLKQVDEYGNAGSDPVVLPSAPLRANGTTCGALTAQGLRLDTGDRIAYGADSENDGPLQFTVNGDEMAARHVSLRFCLPDGASDTTTIVEVRNQVDTRDTSNPADGTPDDKTQAQSLWRVEYRPGTGPNPGDGQLVLVIANAALPWTVSDRTRFGVAAWTSKTDLPSAASDERCRPDPALPFAPADPAERVEFRYQVAGGLQEGRWYHLQVFCASDRPGLHGLILDGVVGRDATQSGVDMTRTGDHYTYPSLRLATAIAMVTPATAGNPAAELSKPSTVEVRFPANVPLHTLLPARGLVRIDDEYLSYTSLIDNGGGTGNLIGIQRARRVNTDQTATEDANGNGVLDTEDVNGNDILDPGEDVNNNGILDTEDTNGNGILDVQSNARRWPVTQRHEVGAIVTPGWAQTELATGQWFRGSASLVQPMQPTPPEAEVGVPSGGWPDADADGLPEFTTPATLTLVSPTGVWPTRGYVRFDIGGEFRRAAFTHSAGTLTLDWAPPATSAASHEFAIGTTITCRVVSIEVDNLFTHGGMVQLLSTADGRCEWIRVDEQADRTGKTVEGKYFIHDQGWSMTAYATPQPLDQPRGAMRTGWTATDPAWAAPGTLVLPVQTLLDADRFESGDVVTFVRKDIDAGGVRVLPVQVVIRHACRDGYPTTLADSGAKWDTKNEWFALTGAVPAAMPDPEPPAPGTASPLLALIGRGWGGDDLSPDGNRPGRRGALPRLKLLNTTSNGQAKVFFGGADSAAGSTTNADAVIIDDLCAGPLQGPSDADANAAAAGAAVNGSEVIEIGGSATGTITATSSSLPVQVRASQAIFKTVNNASMYGLALIDGEAFVFRRIIGDDSRAELIARAMLGTVAVAHTLASEAPIVPAGSSTRIIRPVLPIVILPVGPVAELCSGVAPGAHNVGFDLIEAQYGNYYKDPVTYTHTSQNSWAEDPKLFDRPPFTLVHHPSDGATVEVLRLFSRPASSQRITAKWLRGLYGTPETEWTTPYTPATHLSWWSSTNPPFQTVTPQNQGLLNPIVIGWWPRFAPGLTGSPGAEALRSRSFAWAGFALRLSGSRFDPYGVPVLKAAVGGIADVGVAQDAGCVITASALAAEEATGVVFDWDNAWLKKWQLSQGANDNLVEPFNWARFQLREVDGAELRIHWAATANAPTDLLKAADAAGRAPRLENVRLRCVAPNRILAVEEVR